jgi:putative ABC transport system permease protein
LSSLSRDLVSALRLARRSPGFTSVAVLTLALAIGANAAIFSVVEAVLLRPLPFHDPDRLVSIWNEYQGRHAASAVPDYLDRRDSSRTLESIAAFTFGDATMTGRGEPIRVRVASVTPSFFDVVGRTASVGRVFTAGEDRPGSPGVVLAHGFWQRAFGARTSAIGGSIVIDGVPSTVVGVMPAGFAWPTEPVDVWRPLVFRPDQLTDDERGNEYLNILGRMKPGVDLKQTEADMDAIAASVLVRVPGRRAFLESAHWGAAVLPLLTEVAGEARPTLLVLLSAVGLVLLVACVNLANLLMVRGSFREREIGVRSALGATRWRIARQLLTEHLLLGLAGGAVGVALASWIVGVTAAHPPAGLPRLDESVVDLPVLAFALGLSVLSSVVFGAVPVLRVSRPAASSALVGGGRVSDGPVRRRARAALVAVEVAVAVVVLVGAGLLVRSFDRLTQVDPGFATEGRFTASIALPLSRYREPARRLAFYETLGDRLRALPGVRAVGFTHRLPLSTISDTASFDVEGYAPAPGEGSPGGEYRFVAGDYFRAMGIPLVGGRPFDERDTAGAPPVVVIDEGLAHRYFAGRNPLGLHLDFNGGPHEIVGIVGGVRNVGLDVPARPQVYLPDAQRPLLRLAVVVQAAGNPESLAEPVRRAVRALDAQVPVFDVGTLDERLGRAVARSRYAAMLLAALAGIGLLLSAIGVYGLLAFWVTRESRQIGIRMALGATAADVRRLVLRMGLTPVSVGAVAGLLVAAVLSRVLSGLLFGVSPTDPPTYAAIAAVLFAVALAACALPARRAAATDPARALRSDC